METMGDLLEGVREFSAHNFTKEAAKMLFSWDVSDVHISSAENDETHAMISFENGYIIYVKYFLNLDPTETEDTCEFTLGLKTDMRSRIKYEVHYANYIHGQGYLRLRIGENENRLLQRILEEFYVPALKVIYRPIILNFKGFYARDYFGVEADKDRGELHYCPVRSRSEHKDVRIWDVIGRLTELDVFLKEPQIRHALAELDLQLSFLPSLVGSGLQ